MGVPQARWMVFIKEKNHLEMDDDRGYPIFSGKPHIVLQTERPRSNLKLAVTMCRLTTASTDPDPELNSSQPEHPLHLPHLGNVYSSHPDGDAALHLAQGTLTFLWNPLKVKNDKEWDFRPIFSCTTFRTPPMVSGGHSFPPPRYFSRFPPRPRAPQILQSVSGAEPIIGGDPVLGLHISWKTMD